VQQQQESNKCEDESEGSRQNSPGQHETGFVLFDSIKQQERQGAVHSTYYHDHNCDHF